MSSEPPAQPATRRARRLERLNSPRLLIGVVQKPVIVAATGCSRPAAGSLRGTDALRIWSNLGMTIGDRQALEDSRLGGAP